MASFIMNFLSLSNHKKNRNRIQLHRKMTIEQVMQSAKSAILYQGKKL